MSEFEGLPPELFSFLAGLEENNAKAYWESNKTTWEIDVRAPMKAVLAELDTEFPELRMFRPNRDLQFSKDKPSTIIESISVCQSHQPKARSGARRTGVSGMKPCAA